MGCTRVARRAGSQLANRQIEMSNADTPPNTAGSSGRRPLETPRRVQVGVLERRRHPVDVLPGRTEAASEARHCATAFATSFATVPAATGHTVRELDAGRPQDAVIAKKVGPGWRTTRA